MSHIPDTLYAWVLGAVFFFWFIGAHNRLMRLRSAALVAYGSLDSALMRQLEYANAHHASAAGTAAAMTYGDAPAGSLKAAAGQLATMLAATRLRPLEPGAMAALSTALHVMLSGWERLYPDAVLHFDADGTLSRPAPLTGGGAPSTSTSSAPMAWPEPSAAAEIARHQFNLAVERYNSAISQFPAVLVAWAFRLRSAAPLL